MKKTILIRAGLPWLIIAAWAGGNYIPGAAAENVQLRGSMTNCRLRFEHEKRGHVAFIGGSITEMNGYRPMVREILERRFPETQFTFTDAGISSTCSTTGAFRLQNDVLDKGPVDLFFIEFAVNDDQDAAHARRDCIRGMEGIIRHARRHNPKMDIVITFFVNPSMLATIQADKTPLSADAHENVARHYGIATINLANEVADRIAAGTLTWQQFGGTHPAPAGNAICAGMIDRLMSEAWSKPLTTTDTPADHPMPAKPLDANNYQRGRFIDPAEAEILGGWKLEVPSWKEIGGGFRGRFADLRLLCADSPDAALTLDFEGTAVGAYILAGPDAGIAEASVDGGPWKQIDTYHRFSSGLHYPRTVMFHAELSPGKHKLQLRLAKNKNPKSLGTAMRILQFVAN